MILEDIQLCEEALKSENNKDFFQYVYKKYQRLDGELFIAGKSGALNSSYDNWSKQINQLIGSLRGYLLMKDFPNNMRRTNTKIVIKNKDGIIGNGNVNKIDKKTDINTTVDIDVSKDENLKRKGIFSKIFSIFKGEKK